MVANWQVKVHKDVLKKQLPLLKATGLISDYEDIISILKKIHMKILEVGKKLSPRIGSHIKNDSLWDFKLSNQSKRGIFILKDSSFPMHRFNSTSHIRSTWDSNTVTMKEGDTKFWENTYYFFIDCFIVYRSCLVFNR